MEKVGISPFIDTKAHELFGSGRIICKGIAFTGKFRFNGIAKIFQVDRYIRGGAKKGEKVNLDFKLTFKLTSKLTSKLTFKLTFFSCSCLDFLFSLQGLAVKIKRSLQAG